MSIWKSIKNMKSVLYLYILLQTEELVFVDKFRFVEFGSKHQDAKNNVTRSCIFSKTETHLQEGAPTFINIDEVGKNKGFHKSYLQLDLFQVRLESHIDVYNSPQAIRKLINVTDSNCF